MSKDEIGIDEKESFKDKLYDTKEKVVNLYEENSAKYKAKALRANEEVIDYVKTNPWKAVGLGVIGGLVLGKILRILK